MQEEKKDLATYAYEHIKQMVIDRELMPGERIQQEVLARELGISRTPLVTALNRLASENLVELEANKGFSVRRFSLKEIADIWSLRTAIERMVVEEIAAKISAEDVAYMRSIFAGLEPPWNQEKYAEYTRADRRSLQ
jgi:DNA-binding GntR family transcriptional regulator